MDFVRMICFNLLIIIIIICFHQPCYLLWTAFWVGHVDVVGWSSTTANSIPSAMAQSLLLKRKRQQQPVRTAMTPSVLALAQAKIKEDEIVRFTSPAATCPACTCGAFETHLNPTDIVLLRQCKTIPHQQLAGPSSSAAAHSKMQLAPPEEPTEGIGGQTGHQQAAGSLLGPKDADEYDPARPNDYEEFCNERQAQALAYDRDREFEREQREREREQRRERERERDRDRDREQRGFQPMDEDSYHHRPTPSEHFSSPPSQPAKETAAAAPAAKIDLNVSAEEVRLLLRVDFSMVIDIVPTPCRPGVGERSLALL